MDRNKPDSSGSSWGSWRSDVRSVRGVALEEMGQGRTLADGRFLIERKLGRGAMGVVYAAYDKERECEVAIKTLAISSAPAAFALKQEFRSLRDLRHPGLVRLHELFVEAPRVFFSMDRLTGVPFDTFDSDRLSETLPQLVRAVQALHRGGKLHRDLKPANVLVEADGRVVVLDFGLVLDQQRSARGVGPELVGTPRYMAPELLSWGKATEKSDWYAVGVMLYESLTGVAPHEGALAPLLTHESPVVPSTRNPSVGPQFDQICSQLLRADPQERADGDMILQSLGQRPGDVRDSARPPALELLKGRASHLARLGAALEVHQTSQQPVALMISGLSGMGKTALLKEFIRRQGAGVIVLQGQCREQESLGHKAFDELIDALSEYLQILEPDDVLALIQPDEAQVLLRLFPVLGCVLALSPWVPEAGQAGSPILRQQAYAALGRVLRRLAQRGPLILAIDDLQWGDADSARLLFDIFSSGEPPPCCLLLSFRADERTSSLCLQRLLSGPRCLADFIDVLEVEVAELEPADASGLAAALFARAPQASGRQSSWVQATCKEAQGSPLLLNELAQHRLDHPAEPRQTLGLADVVAARLRQVSELETQLFQLVCVSAGPVSEQLLRVALGQSDIEQAIITLEAQRLIVPRVSSKAGAVEVIHDAIREASLSQWSKEVIRGCHDRLADALGESKAPELDALARHYLGAARLDEASYWAEKAALRASDALAFDRAANLYKMAIEALSKAPWERDGGQVDVAASSRLREAWANALADAGRGHEAAPLFLELAEERSAGVALEFRRRAAEQLLFSGRIEQGQKVLARVFSDASMAMPRSLFAARLSLKFTRLWLSVRGTEFEEARPGDIKPKALLRLDACRVGWMVSFLSTLMGATLQARFLRYALDVGEPERVAMGLGIEALQRSVEGRSKERLRLNERARVLSTRIGSPHALGFQALVDGNCAYLAGEWAPCSESAERAERILTLKCRRSTWELNTLRLFWAMSLSYQGRFRELRRRSRAWLLDAVDRDDLCAQAGLRMNAARSLHLADDDVARAHAELELGLNQWGGDGLNTYRFVGELARVQICLYEGEADKAHAAIRALVVASKQSTIMRVQLCRIHLHHQGAVVALLVASRSTGQVRKRRLARAADHVRKIQKEATPWGNALAASVSAQLLLLHGQPKEAAKAFKQVAAELDERDMAIHAAAIRYRHSESCAGGEATELRERAVVALSSQGVREPALFARMLAPGNLS